jgi:hypothetical protein
MKGIGAFCAGKEHGLNFREKYAEDFFAILKKGMPLQKGI